MASILAKLGARQGNGQTIAGLWDGGDCGERIPLLSSHESLYIERSGFSATAGEALLATLTTDAKNTFIELYDAQGQLLASKAGLRFPAHVGRFIIPATGNYSLIVVSFSATSYTLNVKLGNQPAPTPNPALVHVNAANFSPTALAPDSLVTLFGSNLAATTAVTTTPTTSLGNVTLRLTDSARATHAAQLLFVSPTQINYVMPGGLAYGAATATLTNATGDETTSQIMIAPVAPGLFAADASGRGLAAGVILRIKADQTQQYESLARYDAAQNRFTALPIELSNPNEAVFLVLFGTGFRWNTGLAGVTVQMLDSAGTPINAPVTTGYAGQQGTLSGVDQLNLRLPHTLSGSGECQVLLQVDAHAANALRIRIK